MIWKILVPEDGHQRVNIMDESTTLVGTGEEEVMEMNTTDLTGDIIVQLLEEGEVDFITQRRDMEEVATITTTAIAGEEEGAETITMTTTPWRKGTVIDLLITTMSRPMDTIASTIITAVDTKSIIESSIE